MNASPVEITTAEAPAILLRMLQRNKPCALWAKPGVGKSDLSAQAAEAHGADLIDIRLSMYDPVDVRGLPTIQNGQTVWMKPAELFNEGPRPRVILFDEIDRAAPAVQNVALQIFLNRSVGTHVLPESTRLLAAGNGKTDRVGTNKMSEALARRMSHFSLTVSVPAWLEWAARSDLPPELIAFIRFRPMLLTQLSDKDSNTSEDGLTGVDPRSWASVADLFDDAPAMRLAMMSAKLGKGPALELEAFIRMARGFTYGLDNIIANPGDAPVPHEPGLLHAVISGLARKATYKNLAAIAAYGLRLPVDHEIAMMTQATSHDVTLKQTGVYGAWAASERAKSVTA